MTIYGGGWCYDRKGKYSRKEIYNELMTKEIFFTDYTDDYTTKNAQNVLNLLKQAKAGDIIYLKSYHIKKKLLEIQAIGRFDDKGFVDKTIGGQNGTARSVNWVKKILSNPSFIEIPSPTEHNTTFYEENNAKIIEEIMKRLNEK